MASPLAGIVTGSRFINVTCWNIRSVWQLKQAETAQAKAAPGDLGSDK